MTPFGLRDEMAGASEGSDSTKPKRNPNRKCETDRSEVGAGSLPPAGAEAAD